jgi:uncharacterized delta-60 repeat protein
MIRPKLESLERRALFAAGDLDPTFGNGGIASFDYGDKDQGADVVVQRDGKVVVVGQTGPLSGADYDVLLTRFNTDGSLDPSFGEGGSVVTDFGGRDVARAAALTPDGSIVVVGLSLGTPVSSEQWVVARYTADGDLDPGFDGDGYQKLAVRGGAEGVAVRPDGKAVVVGSSEWGHFGVARFRTDGSLDASFGGDGFVTTTFNQGWSSARVVDFAADGRIVVAGGYSGGGPAGAVVARYLSDGRLDPSFSGDGRSFIEDPYPAPAGISVQPDNKILLLEGDLSFRRLKAGGGYDLTFGQGGVFRLPVAAPQENQFSRDLLRLPDGRLMVSGYAADYHQGAPDTARDVLARVTPDGRLDPTFGGGDGIVALATRRDGLHRTFGALAVAPDGKIVAAGDDTRPSPQEFDFYDDLTAYRFLGDRPVEPPPTGGVIVQAEGGGPFTGAFVSRSNAGYTGSGYVDFSADNGGSAAWNVAGLAGPGDYVVDFRYANGSSSRTLQFEAAPGTPAKNVTFAPTGAWTNWSTVSVPATVGGAGNSLAVVLRTIGSNGPNIDSITVRKTGTPPPAGSTFQAEQATVVGAQVASNTQGYTGTGFVDFLHGTDDSIEWSFDNAGGGRTLTFRYANGSTADRPLELRVNGQVINPRLSFAPTGGWSVWREVGVTVDLAAGINRVKLTSVGNNGANIDVLKVG